MKRTIKSFFKNIAILISVMLFIFVFFGLFYNTYNILQTKTEKLETVKQKLKLKKNKKENYQEIDEKLGIFIKQLMIEVKTKISPLERDIIAQMVVRVSNSIFEKQEHKYEFATLLAIESKFNNKAKSSAGAIGVSQIMPQYANEFGKLCGMKLSKGDIYNTEINMLLGACQFRALLEHPIINNNVSAALVAYNAGPNSKSFRQLIGLENIDNIETASYPTKFNYLKDKAKQVINSKKD